MMSKMRAKCSTHIDYYKYFADEHEHFYVRYKMLDSMVARTTIYNFHMLDVGFFDIRALLLEINDHINIKNEYESKLHFKGFANPITGEYLKTLQFFVKKITSYLQGTRDRAKK
jgi:hypothetical protein